MKSGFLVTLGVGLALTFVACSSGDDSEPTSEPAQPREVGADEVADPPDFEVFMNVKATVSEIEAVRAAVETSEDIEVFAFLDQEAALLEYAELFGEAEAAKIEASELPTSFRIRLNDAHSFEETVEQFGRLVGVNDVRSPTYSSVDAAIEACDPLTDVELFITVGSTAAQIAAVEQALAATNGISATEYRAPEEALVIYECFAERDQDFGEATANDLPASFVLELAPGVDPESLRSELESLPGAETLAIRT